MPTQSTTYNSRVTDEALEKRFRDTFRSQGGAELVDDLYAQGVIVPIVDFTAAATGTTLAQNLQTAWDFSTGNAAINNATNTVIISNSGFWQVDVNSAVRYSGAVSISAQLNIFDGTTSKPIWGFQVPNGTDIASSVSEDRFVVFLRAGDSLRGTSTDGNLFLDVWYRQIATVTGDLVDPSGFTSS